MSTQWTNHDDVSDVVFHTMFLMMWSFTCNTFCNVCCQKQRIILFFPGPAAGALQHTCPGFADDTCKCINSFKTMSPPNTTWLVTEVHKGIKVAAFLVGTNLLNHLPCLTRIKSETDRLVIAWKQCRQHN